MSFVLYGMKVITLEEEVFYKLVIDVVARLY
jgi:hypothetical protein